MIQRILTGVVLALCGFILGGVYILQSVSSLIDQLESQATFHQVETLRESLENRIRAVQSDLLLQNQNQPVLFNKFIKDAEAVQQSVLNCQSCHHDVTTNRYLQQLVSQTALYLNSISRTLTLRANQTRVDQSLQEAYRQGDSLLALSLQATSIVAQGDAERARQVHAAVDTTRRTVLVLVILGPLLIITLVGYFFKRYRGSIAALIDGTRELEKGNLDFQVSVNLKDEFHVLGRRFNAMAINLNREKAYAESVHRMYRGLFDSARDAICIIDTSPEHFCKILTTNAAATELYGYSMTEFLEMDCSRLAPAAEAYQCHEIISRVAANNWLSVVVTRRRKDGTFFPAEVNAGPMDIDGHTYALTFTRDISDREQAKKELLRANQLAVAGQMAVGLAHEIKNPLAGIKTTVEVLSADLDLEPEDRELFGRIVGEVARMERLLKNLLRFARPPLPQIEMIDLHRLLDYTLKNVELTAIKSAPHQVTLVHDFEQQAVPVKADSSQIQQVLLNLYLNAIEAFQQDGEIATRVRLSDDGESVRIEIEDNGPGISAGVLDNIFTPFFTTKSRGTGLGLPICQRLIEQHHGTITVTSEPGQGTCFVITLPMTQQLVRQEGEQHD